MIEMSNPVSICKDKTPRHALADVPIIVPILYSQTRDQTTKFSNTLIFS